MILQPPADFDVTRASRDLALGHPFLQERVPKLRAVLTMRGYATLLVEVFRYDARQQWLYGAGRTGVDCLRRNVPSAFARPADRPLTDAWSAATTAHGYILQTAPGVWVPASCAVDLVPVGADGKPFTADDPWEAFTGRLEADANALGLRHFRNSAGHITDLDHLQLTEWDDATSSLGSIQPSLAMA